MKEELSTLKTLVGIVGEQTHPTQYKCTPREMILHSKVDWSVMEAHLHTLESVGYVSILQTNPISFFITDEGLEKGQSFEGRKPGIRHFICL